MCQTVQAVEVCDKGQMAVHKSSCERKIFCLLLSRARVYVYLCLVCDCLIVDESVHGNAICVCMCVCKCVHLCVFVCVSE